MKKILYFCALFLLFPIISSAASTEIVGLESTIDVKKNRTANVEEKINLYIIDKTDEFEKNIDKKYFAYRKDGSKIYIDSKLKNISSKKLLKTNSSNNKETIKLKLDGKKDTIETINLKYSYNLGKDKSKDYDEFYYNIVNSDSVASNVNFEITLPEDAKINNIDFAIDDKYNLLKDDVTYSIEDNVITGYLNVMLNENQKFTIRVEFPNNYFINVSDNFNYLKFLYLLFPLITLVIIFMYWWKYARNNKFKQEVTNVIPNNYDPVEISYLYKGFSEENDLIIDLIFLANKGYLSIEENEDGYKLDSQNTFKFIKNKDYDGNNAVQKLLFEGIFKESDIVELKDIEYGYSSKIIDTKKMIDNKENKLKLFNVEINKIKKIFLVLLSICVLVLNIEPVKQLTNSYLLIPVLAFLMALGIAIMSIFDTKGTSKKIFGFILFFAIAFISVYTLIGQTKLVIIYLLQLILIFVTIFLYKKIPIRTLYGNKNLAEINAFKIGLLSMSPKEIEEKQKENSNYFYDMIPYTFALGITDEWVIKGKSIVKNAPYWHITKEQFDLNKEIRFFKNVIFTTSKVMIKAIYAKNESTQIEYKIYK